MMENMRIFNQVNATPAEARKQIKGGRLSGMTDINPMWRIKRLTEVFGPCGVGWTKRRAGLEFVPGANGEIAVFVTIELRVLINGVWSEPIEGNGGAMYVAKETKGLYVDDEAVKKAETDALGSACKLLGFSADIYWERDPSKYGDRLDEKPPAPPLAPQAKTSAPVVMFRCEDCGEVLSTYCDAKGREVGIRQHVEGSKKTFGKVLCLKCIAKQPKENANQQS